MESADSRVVDEVDDVVVAFVKLEEERGFIVVPSTVLLPGN